MPQHTSYCIPAFTPYALHSTLSTHHLSLIVYINSQALFVPANAQLLLSSAVIWHRGALSLRQILLYDVTPYYTILHFPTAYFPFWRFARV